MDIEDLLRLKVQSMSKVHIILFSSPTINSMGHAIRVLSFSLYLSVEVIYVESFIIKYMQRMLYIYSRKW